MKFIYLIIIVIGVQSSLFGQSFKVSAYTSPLISNYEIERENDNQQELKVYFGFSGGVIFEYHLLKRLNIGTGVTYSYLRGKFYTPCYCGHTMDRNIEIRNSISTHNLEIPFIINLRLNQNESKFFYLQSGIALNWLMSAKRIVESETDFLNGSEFTYEEIVDESFSLQNKNNNSIGSS